jgi:hypothetical protein
MAEITFSKNGEGVIDVASETVKPTAPVNEVTSGGKVYENAAALAKTTEPEAKPPVVYGPPAKIQSGSLAPSGIVLGDRLPDFKDIILPRLNLVQGVGLLKDQFPVGAIVFGQNTVLFTPPVVNPKTGNMERAALPPVNITILGFRPTRFVEKLVGGARGMICNTEDEVRAAGGTLSYKEAESKRASGMKLFQEMAEALVAVRRPEVCGDDDTMFVYPVEENGVTNKYALALWSMKGSAYTAAAKRVFFTGRAVGCLRGGYPTYNFDFTARFETWVNGNSAWVPVCVPCKKSTDGFLEFARAILNPPVAE